MRKQDFCLCENSFADQLCSSCKDSTNPLLKTVISSFWPVSVTVHAGLCWSGCEIQIVGFLMTGLICFRVGLSHVVVCLFTNFKSSEYMKRKGIGQTAFLATKALQ